MKGFQGARPDGRHIETRILIESGPLDDGETPARTLDSPTNRTIRPFGRLHRHHGLILDDNTLSDACIRQLTRKWPTISEIGALTIGREDLTQGPLLRDQIGNIFRLRTKRKTFAFKQTRDGLHESPVTSPLQPLEKDIRPRIRLQGVGPLARQVRFLDLARQDQGLDSGLTQILENRIHLTQMMPMACRGVLGEIRTGQTVKPDGMHATAPARCRRSDLLGKIAVACDQTQ